MRKAAICLFLLLSAATIASAGIRRRAVAHPSQPNNPNQANVIVSIGTTGRTLPAGFSGINFGEPENALRYDDPQAAKLLSMIGAGWVRFPGGTVGNPHNWETGDMAQTLTPFPYVSPSQWICAVEEGVRPAGNLNGPCVAGSPESFLEQNQITNMGKGFTKFSDFRLFAAGVGALITANTFTDSVTHIAALAKSACSPSTGVRVIEFELSNESYIYPGRWPRGSAYVSEMASFRSAIETNCPGVPIALFYAGQYWGGPPLAPNWDSDLFAGTPGWDDIATHIYPQFTSSSTCGNACAADAAAFYNGFLVTGTNEYLDSYFVSRKPNASIDISEVNLGISDGRTLLQQTIYQGLFLSEYIARVSSDAHVRYVGVHQLYQPGGGNGSMILAANDHIAEVVAAAKSGSGPVNTTGFNFGFTVSVAGKALALVNGAVNRNSVALGTTVTSGPLGAATVASSPTDPSATVPAVFAQAYGSPPQTARSVVIVNKGAATQIVSLIDNSVAVSRPLTVSLLSGTAVTDTAPVSSTTTQTNPVRIPPFSVARIDY